MNLVDGESGSELLQAHVHVWNHMFNYIDSMCLKCALQLGIPDIIHNHGKPMTLAQLLTALPLHPTKTHFLHRLMRLLVHTGFFTLQKVSENDPEQGYVLTTASLLLLKNNPVSVTPFLMGMLDPVFMAMWHHLSTWFQNDDATPFRTAHGLTQWEYAEREPKFNQFFNESMASDARFVSSLMIGKCKDVFEGLNSLVDVGGGTGSLAKSIAKEFPQLQCTVFDLPRVVANQQSDGNPKYVGGDMFETVPPADAILLKWVLHDFNDEECVKILKNCKEAITSNKNSGKVIIIDMVMGKQKEDKKTIETELYFDMLLMSTVTGKERDEKEWAKLFLEAGFSHYNIIPKLGLRDLIEVYP